MSHLWRVGIIGCGWAGQQHANALLRLQTRASLVAVADRDVTRAETIARVHDAGLWTANYVELLDRQTLNAVIIALPHHLHAEVAIAAAEAGLHVLIEKPLASTLADADAMIAAAEKAGVQLMVAENVRYDPLYLKVVELIQAGEIGDVFLLRLIREHQIHNYMRQRPWFLTDADAGITMTGAIHEFEILRMVAGEIEHVYALEAPKVLAQMVADETSVMLAGMQSGAAALIAESFSVRTPNPGIHGAVHGSQGSVWFYKDRLQHYTASADGQTELAEEIIIEVRDTFEVEITHFFDCLNTGQEPITSGRESRKPLVAVQAAYESMRRGERVYLSEMQQNFR
jgi:predicted dehydrogenase